MEDTRAAATTKNENSQSAKVRKLFIFSSKNNAHSIIHPKRHLCQGARKSLFRSAPVQILEPCLDVRGAAGGAELGEVGVFPNVEDEDDREFGEEALMVLVDPGVAELADGLVPIQNRPTDAAHTADGFEARFPRLDATELFGECGGKGAVCRERLCAVFPLLEIEFVEADAVEFEGETAGGLRKREHIFLRILQHLVLGGEKCVRIFYIAGIEAEMCGNRLRRDAVEGGDSESAFGVHKEVGDLVRRLSYL